MRGNGLMIYNRNAPIKCKLDGNAKLPHRAHDIDAGADVFCRAGFTIAAHGFAIIRTGVHVELLPNTAGVLMSKSGLYINHDIVSTGLIDEGFTGEVIVKLANLGEHAYHFNEGDKVSQLVVIPVLYPAFVKVDEIGGGERGDAGYGSTGA